MEKILKSRFKMCKFTIKKISNKSRIVCKKVATVWVEPRDVIETAGIESLTAFCSLFGTFRGSLLFKVLVISGEG